MLDDSFDPPVNVRSDNGFDEFAIVKVRPHKGLCDPIFQSYSSFSSERPISHSAVRFAMHPGVDFLNSVYANLLTTFDVLFIGFLRKT